MGKIKSKQVKRGIHQLLNVDIELTSNFEMNKKVLGAEMPSKRMRNKMAGYAARLIRQKEADLAALQK